MGADDEVGGGDTEPQGRVSPDSGGDGSLVRREHYDRRALQEEELEKSASFQRREKILLVVLVVALALVIGYGLLAKNPVIHPQVHTTQTVVPTPTITTPVRIVQEPGGQTVVIQPGPTVTRTSSPKPSPTKPRPKPRPTPSPSPSCHVIVGNVCLSQNARASARPSG